MNEQFQKTGPASNESRSRPKNKKLIMILAVTALLILLLVCSAVSVYLLVFRGRNTGNDSNSTDSNTSTSAQIDCEQVYDDWVEANGEDFKSCIQDLSFETCEKPEGFDDSYFGDTKILLVLDASGSMGGKVDGVYKINAAKKALIDFLEVIPEKVELALWIYGEKGGAQSGAGCTDTSLAVDFTTDKNKLKNRINSIKVKEVIASNGWTPIGLTLDKIAKKYGKLDSEDNDFIVYLVSDGEESCGGSPVKEAKELASTGLKPIINVIGFDVNNVASKQLKDISIAGNGDYFSPKTAEELSSIFDNEEEKIRAFDEYKRCMLNAEIGASWDVSNVVTDETFCLVGKLTSERFSSALADVPDDCREDFQERYRTRDQLMSDFIDNIRAGRFEDRENYSEQIKQQIEDVEEEFFSE
ncbi:MAG: VWA domain-containing protein [Candidatus Dojkabacteria bacterium]|nr:VWA domain-containing protein [Candidatus Dojkabacteria bacterium]